MGRMPHGSEILRGYGLSETAAECVLQACAEAGGGPRRERTKYRILIAEDNRITQQIIEFALDALDVELYFVYDGAQAVSMASETDFDLMIMDMRMPLMTGLEALELIFAWYDADNRPRPRWIALTADITDQTRDHAERLGVTTFMRKPVDVLELQREVTTVRQNRKKPGGGRRGHFTNHPSGLV
ncbi:MAG: hypothetical protein Alpg2KO_18260 [Alphaproteobacteria bacterium]